MSAQDFMWLAIGAASLIIAITLAIVFVRLAGVLDRTQETLRKVDHMLDTIEPPVTATLDHVGGVLGNVDSMVTRVNRLTEMLERVATGIAKAADAAQAAVSPTVANVVGVVAGVSRGAQAFFRSRHSNGSQ
ncbi:MAG: hypothetical protein M3Z37_02270 [Candidatus Eremiobacteraeota bacterium]|nr:hypothetical protein [Candidatus Eremiobacteraeota bacterium]